MVFPYRATNIICETLPYDLLTVPNWPLRLKFKGTLKRLAHPVIILIWWRGFVDALRPQDLLIKKRTTCSMNKMWIMAVAGCIGVAAVTLADEV